MPHINTISENYTSLKDKCSIISFTDKACYPKPLIKDITCLLDYPETRPIDLYQKVNSTSSANI